MRGSREVKAADTQAGYDIKLQTQLEDEKDKDLLRFYEFKSIPSLSWCENWQRGTAISLSGWFGDVKSNWIYTETYSIRVFKRSQGVACQSGFHLTTDSADC